MIRDMNIQIIQITCLMKIVNFCLKKHYGLEALLLLLVIITVIINMIILGWLLFLATGNYAIWLVIAAILNRLETVILLEIAVTGVRKSGA